MTFYHLDDRLKWAEIERNHSSAIVSGRISPEPCQITEKSMLSDPGKTEERGTVTIQSRLELEADCITYLSLYKSYQKR